MNGKKSLDISRQAGNKFGIMYSLQNLAQLAIENGDIKQANLLAEEGLALSRELGERRGTSYAFLNLGRIAMHEGIYQRANELLRESLKIIWSTRDRDSILEHLITMADNAVRERRFDFASRLLAACEAAKAGLPANYRFFNQPTYNHLVEVIPDYIDEGTFTAAWTLGGLMSLEQAVGYALKDHSQKPAE